MAGQWPWLKVNSREPLGTEYIISVEHTPPSTS